MSATARPPVRPPPARPGRGRRRERLGDVRAALVGRRQAGDLGSLPIVIGLIVIAIVFQTQNRTSSPPGNFVNLIVQSAPITTIAMGIVFVLLLGEIDLSVGYVGRRGGRDHRAPALPGRQRGRHARRRS